MAVDLPYVPLLDLDPADLAADTTFAASFPWGGHSFTPTGVTRTVSARGHQALETDARLDEDGAGSLVTLDKTIVLVYEIGSDWGFTWDNTSFAFHWLDLGGYIRQSSDNYYFTVLSSWVQSLPVFSVDQVQVLALSRTSGTIVSKVYANGAPAIDEANSDGDHETEHSTSEGGIEIPVGRTYRFLVFDQVLTDAEIATLSADLMDFYSQPPLVTLTWGAPLHDGGLPVLGYQVQWVQDGQLQELDVEGLTVSMRIAGPVGVYARSAAGLSAPAETNI